MDHGQKLTTKTAQEKKANYIKGVPEGEQITYVFPGPMDNNKRLEYINYEEGKPVGTWTQWSRDSENRLRKTGEIVFEEGAGRWREWDPNTLVVIRAGDYEDWQRNGLWKSWDAQEVLVSEGEYIGGKKLISGPGTKTEKIKAGKKIIITEFWMESLTTCLRTQK